jgi:catechol 2,3-dioxygenase
MPDYQIPAQTRIGHVHLKVSNLQRSLDFYCGLLGFELMVNYADSAAFISAGGYHHHIGLIPGIAKTRPLRLSMHRVYIILPFCILKEKIWQRY